MFGHIHLSGKWLFLSISVHSIAVIRLTTNESMKESQLFLFLASCFSLAFSACLDKRRKLGSCVSAVSPAQIPKTIDTIRATNKKQKI
jgi:hypothetical protein